MGVFSLTPQGALRWTNPELYDRQIVDYAEIVFGPNGNQQQLYFYANNHLRALTLNGVSVFTELGRAICFLRIGERSVVLAGRGETRTATSTQERNGFVFFSVPILVGGPWPESTVTSSPSGNNFFLIPSISRSISPPGKSPRPMLPAKRTSPPMSNRSLREKKQRLPGQWPGTSRTWKSVPRKFRFGVSSIRKSGSTGSISSANPKLRKKSRSEIMGAVSG
jgi:hypothetical protein